MKPKTTQSIIAVVLVLATWTDAKAETILFESGALGPTGVTWQEGLDGEVQGSSVSDQVFSGVRFELTQPILTTEIGGHFFSPNGGEFFGAIVALDDENDFPNSEDLSTSDVLGVTSLVFPVDSAEAFGDINLSLDPGWYALAYGSGLFGVDGEGGMVLNNPDIGNPTYLARQLSPGWFNLSDLSDAKDFVDFRFVIKGTIIPEPASVSLVVAGLLCFRFRFVA